MGEARILPPDWGVRGIYIPYAHPKLAGARLRWRSASAADIILPPEPGNLVGQYVVEIRRLGEAVRLDPFDRRLTELIADLRPVDPIQLERTAMRARHETNENAIDTGEARFLSTVARSIDRIARRVSGAARVFNAEVGGPEADRIFASTGMTALDVVSRLEDFARATAAIDRGRIDELAEFAARLRVVLEHSVWSDAERLRLVEQAATRVLREARMQAAILDELDRDPLAAIAGEGPAGAERAAVRAAWWLDGWPIPVALYGAVADDARPEAVEAALRAVIRTTPVVPANPAFMPARPGVGPAPDSAVPAPQRVVRSATVRANVDWLTGQPAQQVQAMQGRPNGRQARG